MKPFKKSCAIIKGEKEIVSKRESTSFSTVFWVKKVCFTLLFLLFTVLSDFCIFFLRLTKKSHLQL